MSGNRVAKRYARALFKMAGGDLNKGAQYATALESVASLFSFEDASAVLKSPVMPADLKISLLNFALKKAASPDELQQFVKHVEAAGRTTLLPEISSQFQILLNEAKGVMHATVKSAVALSASDLETLKSTLQAKFGKKIEVSTSVDPAIGAGLLIGVGSSVIDLTLRTRLSALVNNARS